jgi:predicted Zn-ribbon and HTH transcriptional regulator
MGWISDRRMRTGHGIGGYNPQSPKNGAPLRKIVHIIRHSEGMFSPARVELECGHETNSHGTYKARCVQCKSQEMVGR